jgi:light-regulated signal transduction histidine kinase (bacteriophytochrome)
VAPYRPQARGLHADPWCGTGPVIVTDATNPGRPPLCVIDTVPRGLTPEQERALRSLSRAAGRKLELRRQDARLRDLDRAIAEGHGGRIAVDSRVGEGTRFTVELPACA